MFVNKCAWIITKLNTLFDLEMPPKGKDKGPSAKTLKKEKEKVIEDKTFGLKNAKKSKQV